VAVDRFPVEAGHILTFARAIGDDNPVYRDPDAAEAAGLDGIIAPPTFVMAAAHFDPDYPLRPALGKPWFGSGREATGVASQAGSTGTSGTTETALHAEQHFEYHRPLRAGDVLTSSSHDGRTWEKEGKVGGTMTFTEFVTEYRDAEGSLVVTATTVGVRIRRPAGGH
jgi:acyl dehydratase